MTTGPGPSRLGPQDLSFIRSQLRELGPDAVDFKSQLIRDLRTDRERRGLTGRQLVSGLRETDIRKEIDTIQDLQVGELALRAEDRKERRRPFQNPSRTPRSKRVNIQNWPESLTPLVADDGREGSVDVIFDVRDRATGRKIGKEGITVGAFTGDTPQDLIDRATATAARGTDPRYQKLLANPRMSGARRIGAKGTLLDQEAS